MEENKTLEVENLQHEEKKSAFDFQAIFTLLVLNWKWFLLSLILCVGSALIYLRYTTPVYQAYAKFLIKEEDNGRGGKNSLLNAANLGMMTNSAGLDNEMEILTSLSLSAQTIRDLKIYTTYMLEGKVKDQLLYKNQPISVDIDATHLDKINAPISLVIKREGAKYILTGTYYKPIDEETSDGPYTINKEFTTLPYTLPTSAGILTFTANGSVLPDGKKMKITIVSPKMASYKYVGSFSVGQTSKTTSIARLVLTDQSPKRAIDYLKQLTVCYNRQANEDKNEIAYRTEAFINDRLEKINSELGATEDQLEAYKKQNKMVELKMNATQAMSRQEEFSQRLVEANTQVALLNSMTDYMNQPSNKYQTLPINVGLADQTATSLINKYNEIVLERNRMLKSASENSPTIAPLTSQLDDLAASIRRAMAQARRNMDIQRNSVVDQYNKYNNMMMATPDHERMLTQIGRQQEVKSGLYLMLLQKREENSISLAATADKGKLLDEPQFSGKVSPKSSMILLAALLAGIGIPAVIIFLLQFLRYKIEGHDDVASLTKLPILADVAIASDQAKTRADIVVHENRNNQMEEIFRSMRTNLQFMLKEGQKVILFTSTTSGEGKTFNAANLAVSFALLGKKVVLVGLDIRKPRLAELFEIQNHHNGITPLLTMQKPTWEDVKAQILPSEVNKNLDLLMAGPIPPNPAELIARPSLDVIVDILKENYDYVLIDTAPVGLVTDTLQIGRVADATIYMCRADYTPKESFNLINGLSYEKKLPNMAVVLNGIDMSKKKYGYYYGYGSYGKYGRYGRYGSYGRYGNYGSYGNYSQSHYGDKNDNSVKR